MLMFILLVWAVYGSFFAVNPRFLILGIFLLDC